MAWTAPRTWVVGEIVTAAQLNTHLRDNLAATAPALSAAKGDVFAGTAANAIGRVAVGADNSVLTADAAQAAGVKWSAQRHIEAHLSPGTSSAQTVTWDTPFTAAPIVVATPNADPTSVTAYMASVNSITTTGCVVETHSIADGGGVNPESIVALVIAMDAN